MTPAPASEHTTSETFTNHFTQDDLRLANATVEIWAQAHSLMPFDRGMQLVERIGAHRYLTTIAHADEQGVTTTSGHRYTTRGAKIRMDADDTEHRSLTSPWYLLTDKSLGAKRGAGGGRGGAR